MRPALALVAGEASGDLLASLLLEGLYEQIAGLETHGIGGPRMIARGFRADWPMERLAVRGYAEVLRHYPGLVAIRRQLRRALLADPPAAFVGVDAPDFNLDLERALRARGVPTIHFISPSIWAWRRERLEKIRQAVDHMLVLFPFEEALYREAGVAVTYVGHPLADIVPDVPDRLAARARLGLPPDEPVLAVMPGSRLAEIHYHSELFLAAAALLASRAPRLHVIAPMAGRASRASFERILARMGATAPPVQIVDHDSHGALAACDAALIASGTATLEAALFKRPMVIAYRMAYLSWLMNILAREVLVPEVLQDAATPAALADALATQLFDDANRSRLERRFLEMHHSLRRDTARTAARVVAEVMTAGGAHARS
jgi:lipid-A-disaccharide synthase